MSRTTIVVAFLDKAWPPEHSFVDGMLAGELAEQRHLRVRLIVSRTNNVDTAPRRYRRACCLPSLYPRRRVGRLLNLLVAMGLILYQTRREQRPGRRVVLFVRNDPVCLLAASLLRGRVDHLVFQSSFPHEQYSGNVLKRTIARYLYRGAGIGVDAVMGVSPEGTARARRLCPSASNGGYIPLLADEQISSQMVDGRKIDPAVGPIFVYVGTHSRNRELRVVLSAIVRALKEGIIARFRFVGANHDEENQLLAVDGVRGSVKSGLIRFERPLPRSEIANLLANCDVGISLIPPRQVYYESSPTKLAEYMGAGLAVIASRGIPMQERFVQESGGGILVDWTSDAIVQGIVELAENPDQIVRLGRRSATYAKEALQYGAYLQQFCKTLSIDAD